jgi:hypothetical protein
MVDSRLEHTNCTRGQTSAAAHSGTAQLRSDVVDVDTVERQHDVCSTWPLVAARCISFTSTESARDVVKLHLHAYQSKSRLQMCGHSLKYSMSFAQSIPTRVRLSRTVARCLSASRLSSATSSRTMPLSMLGEFVFQFVLYCAHSCVANVPRV